MCTHSAVVFRQCIVVQLQLCHSSAASGFKGSNQTSKPVSELLTEESFGIETAGMVQGFSAALCMLVDLHVASSVWYALQDLSRFQVVCTPRFVKLFRFFCEHLQLAPPSDRPASASAHRMWLLSSFLRQAQYIWPNPQPDDQAACRAQLEKA